MDRPFVQTVGWGWTHGWIWVSIGLYVVTGALWLPVVWMQSRMRNLARAASVDSRPLPRQYFTLFRLWYPRVSSSAGNYLVDGSQAGNNAIRLMLLLDSEQLDLEDQNGARRNSRPALVAVGSIRGADETIFAADLH